MLKFCVFLFFLLNLPLPDAFSPENLHPKTSIYDEFRDVIGSIDKCTDWYRSLIIDKHPRNATDQSIYFQKELYKEFIDLRKEGVDDVNIEKVLGVYCEAKNAMQRHLNELKPPHHLKGNFSWDFSLKLPVENFLYHLGVSQKEKHMREFNLMKQSLIQKVTSQNISLEKTDIKVFFRIAAFIITVSLGLSIQHLLRQYYRNDWEEEEDDEEMEEVERDANFRVELMQVAVLFCSLTYILTILYDDLLE